LFIPLCVFLAYFRAAPENDRCGSKPTLWVLQLQDKISFAPKTLLRRQTVSM
jgi:hypothetical protein